MTITPPAVPDGADSFTDQEWDTATDRVRSTRAGMREHPQVAEIADNTYNTIAGRVHTLAALRKARGLTQQQISAQLDISQAEVSRMERRGNLQLDTLSRFIEATGGKLRITATFDDREVEVGIGDLLETEQT